MIQVTGTLVNPMGIAASDVKIRVEATDTDVTLFGMVASTNTDALGGYDFNLVNGTHQIEINFSDEFKVIKEVTVSGTTPTPITLPALLA